MTSQLHRRNPGPRSAAHEPPRRRPLSYRARMSSSWAAGDATDEALHDGAVGRDEERLGHAGHAVGHADGTVVVDHDRPARRPAWRTSARASVRLVVEQDADDGRVARPWRGARRRRPARGARRCTAAPRGEEVHDHPAAPLVGEVERVAVEGGAGDGRRQPSDQRAARDPLGAGRPRGQHGHQQGDEDGDDGRRHERRARSIRAVRLDVGHHRPPPASRSVSRSSTGLRARWCAPGTTRGRSVGGGVRARPPGSCRRPSRRLRSRARAPSAG